MVVAQSMSMTGEEVLQLLEEFKAGKDHQNAKHFLLQHQQLCDVVCELVQEKYADEEIIEVVCHELLTFYYRGGAWKCFCVQFLPSIIGTYLSAIGQGHRKHCAHFETLMLSIYNNEVSKTERIEQIRLPSLSNPSIYHKDPAVLLSGTMLTESAVSRLHGKEIACVEIGPYPTCASLNAENRFLILTWLVKFYNSYLNFVNPSTVTLFCKLCTRLCRSGFHFPESDLVRRVVTSEVGKDVFRHVADYADLPRVNLHSSFMLELLNGVYYAMFSTNSTLVAVQALDDIRQRACYELYPDVLLVTNAIANSLVENPSGSPSDGPMGIQTIVSQMLGGSAESVRRRLVTNASLKIKKPSDDIPIKSSTMESITTSEGSSSSTTSPVSVEQSVVGTTVSKKQSDASPAPPPHPRQLLFADNVCRGGLKESRSEVNMKELQKMQQQDHSEYTNQTAPPNGELSNDLANRETSFMEYVDEEEESGRVEDGFSLKTPPMHRVNNILTVHVNGSSAERNVKRF